MMAMGIGRFALTPQMPQFKGAWQADLFWPCFGLAAALGVVVVSVRRHSPHTPRRGLMSTLWLQAAGVFACLLGNGWGLALGYCCAGRRSWRA